jgi:hypothetical protein
MSDRTGMNIGQGNAPPSSGEVGLRNQLRARWREQPLAVHAGVSIALFLIVAGALWSLDHSLSYAVLTIGALYWVHRLPPLPYKLAAQILLGARYPGHVVLSLPSAPLPPPRAERLFGR